MKNSESHIANAAAPYPQQLPNDAQLMPSLVTHKLCQTSVKNTKGVIIKRLFFLLLFYRPAPLSHQHLGAHAVIKGRSLPDQGFQ